MITKNILYVTSLMLLSLFLASCSDDGDNMLIVTPDATGTMTDIDGYEYPYVRIGGLDWMARNLNSGEPWYYQDYLSDNDIENSFYVDDEDAEAELCSRMGNFYTYQQALDQCPEGWRLPTDEDWQRLETALGMNQSDATASGWRNGAAQLMMQGTGEGTGLNLCFPGVLASYSTASFGKYHFGDYGYYWTATIDNTVNNKCAFIRKITPGLNKVFRGSSPVNRWMSVRYVRDAR